MRELIHILLAIASHYLLILKFFGFFTDGTMTGITFQESATLPPNFNEMVSDSDTPRESSEMAQLVLRPEDTEVVFPTSSIALDEITIPGYEHVTFNTS